MRCLISIRLTRLSAEWNEKASRGRMPMEMKKLREMKQTMFSWEVGGLGLSSEALCESGKQTTVSSYCSCVVLDGFKLGMIFLKASLQSNDC